MLFTLNEIASAHFAAGRPHEAESYRLRALRVAQELFENDHHMVSGTRVYLAMEYRSGGRFVEAEQHLRAALESYKSVLGSGSRTYQLTLVQLGMTLVESQKYDEAIKTLSPALAEKTGTDAYYLLGRAGVCQYLGTAYLRKGDAERAAELLGIAFQISQTPGARIQGDEVRDLLESYKEALKELNRTAELVPVEKRLRELELDDQLRSDFPVAKP